MLMERNQSCLLLIDVQEKLSPLVQHFEAMISNCRWLRQLALDLQIPCLVSEQYPKGLGHTVNLLQGTEKPFEKIDFSCFRSSDFKTALEQKKKTQMILTGIETHVCVLQTALDLQEAGYATFVVVDAVSSRFATDNKYALKRMQQAGITLVSCEMVFFEWLGQAGSEAFKRLSKKYLQGGVQGVQSWK